MGNKIPKSWFDDDPEWEFLRRKSEKQPIPKELKEKVAASKPKASLHRDTPRAKAVKEVTNEEVVFSLKLALPKIKLNGFKNSLKTYKKQIYVVTGTVLSLIVITWGYNLISDRNKSNSPEKPLTPVEQANFTPLVQLENLKDASGKTTNPELKYYKDKKTLNFVSEYNGTKLIVSQQLKPDPLKSNPGQLEGIAMTINPNLTIEKLETQKGIAYIGTDEEYKVQKVIFATDDLLVFIDASKIMDNDDWKFYINQLNPKN